MLIYTILKRLQIVISMIRLEFYLDCVCVDLFVINITQRLLQSVHCVKCKVACVVRVESPGRHQGAQPGGDRGAIHPQYR